MLGPQHVGQRVAVRRIAGTRDARPVFSDILGHLLEATETHLTISAQSGAVRVPRSEITHAKPVPPRRLTPTERLEAAAALGWPAVERSHLGGWLLRATDGWTQRANSALIIGDPGVPLSEAIDFVQRWYFERALVPAMSLPVPLFSRLDTELERRGWSEMPVTQVMTAPLAALRPSAPLSSSGGSSVGGSSLGGSSLGGAVHLATEPSDDWLRAVAGRKGALPASALHVLTAVPHVRFAEWRDESGTLLATARGCVADEENRWLGLSLIGVDESMRRRGLARLLIAALAEWAAGLGARDAYLQVERRNTAAVTLYDRLGFTVAHAYSSRRLLTR